MPKSSMPLFKTILPVLNDVRLSPSYAGPYEEDDPVETWSICGYTELAAQNKRQFLLDASRWWRVISQALATVGYTEYLIHPNASGVATSGAVYAEFRRPGAERWIYGWIEAMPGSMAYHRAAIALNQHVWGDDPPRAPDYDSEAKDHPRSDHLGVVARWRGVPPRPNYSPVDGPNVWLPTLGSISMAAVLLREVAQEPALADQLLAAWSEQQARKERRATPKAKGSTPTPPRPPTPSRVVQMTLI